MRLRCWSVILLFVVALVCLIQQAAVTAQQKPDAILLKLDTPVERTLSGTQAHLYRINLSKGEAVRIEVEQRGIDLMLLATVGEGKDFARVNVRNTENGSEPLYLLTEAGTEVRLTVRGTNPRGGAGGYTIKLVTRREATEEDRHLFKAQTLTTEAQRLASQGDLKAKAQAWTFYEQALLIWQNQKENAWRATVLLQMGRLALELNHHQEARDFFSRAATLGFNLEDAPLEAAARQGLCRVHNVAGDRAEELKCLDKLTPFFKAAQDEVGTAQLLLGQARAYLAKDENMTALQVVQQAIPIFNGAGAKSGEADGYELLGQIFTDMFDRRKALDSFNQALVLRRLLNDKPAEMALLNRIGQLQLLAGEAGKARETFTQTLALSQHLNDKPMQATLLQQLGALWYEAGDVQKALVAYRAARPLTRDYARPEIESRALIGFAQAALDLNQPAEVAAALTRANELTRLQADRVSETAVALQQSRLAALQKDHQASRRFAQNAYLLARQIGHYPSERAALLLSARAAYALGDSAAAFKDSEAAYALSEAPRGKAYETELREKGRRADHEMYLNLLMQENARKIQAGYNSLAFQLSERARANSLLELLTLAQADLNTWADPDLLRNERELVATLRRREAERLHLTGNRQAVAQLAELTSEIGTLTKQYQAAQQELFDNNPRYAALVRPKPLSLSEVQALLDEDTSLLEYALGVEKSYAWLVSKNSAQSFTLAAGATIETLAQRVAQASASPANNKNGEVALRELSNLVIAPLAAQLKTPRLLIIPDGALHYVPFAALYEDKMRVLSLRREVAHLPSAAVLPLLQSTPPAAPVAGKELAVIADPVLQPNDPRVTAAYRTNEKVPLPAALAGMAANANNAGFTRRTLARREARVVSEFLTKGEPFNAFAFNANREALMNGQFSEYRVLHFDVPVVINAQKPEWSGFVLSLVNAEGQPVPGFLSLADLYKLTLNADLVTLSAARTALGNPARSEALVGVTRGLMYAGARHVLTSLWEVDSVATADFMRIFYENLFDRRLSPPAALHSAQVVMRKNPRWKAPHYWAGFVVEGTWR